MRSSVVTAFKEDLAQQIKPAETIDVLKDPHSINEAGSS
jgi:hypothetical protein